MRKRVGESIVNLLRFMMMTPLQFYLTGVYLMSLYFLLSFSLSKLDSQFMGSKWGEKESVETCGKREREFEMRFEECNFVTAKCGTESERERHPKSILST